MANIVTLTPNPAIDVWTSVARVVPTRKLRCSAQRRDPGGGGINVARVVKRLGGDVTAIYPAGGATGELLRRLVAREQISDLTIPAVEETREDFTVFETDSDKEYRFVLPGPPRSEREWAGCLDLLASASRNARYVVGSGTLPPGVPDDFYARAGRIAKAAGAKMVIDASGPPFAAAVSEAVYLIKPNLDEFSEFTGKPLAHRKACVAAARELVATGKVEVVTLTLGHHGALLVTREGAWFAPPLPITAVSAVGAGDSFLGGMVFALAAGRSPVDAFRTAVAAGSAALLHAGTELCRAEDIPPLCDQVKIKPV
jgi:6-phosphofructokinase 2